MNSTKPVSQVWNPLLQAGLFVLVGLFGIFINSITIWAINKCERLSKMASVLMTLQCSINIFGLLPKVSYGPLVTAVGRHLLPEGLVRRIPGAILMFSLYSGFLLQACMAITRLIVFRRMGSHQTFGQRTCNFVIIMILVYGSIWFMLAMHPCCSIQINPITGRHGFKISEGSDKRMISVAGLTNDFVTFPITTVCYVWALAKMGNLRSAVQSETITWSELKHEVKVLLQFLLVSIVWALHVGLFRAIHFNIIGIDLWYMMTISEVNRYIFFCIDPIVYCIFIQEVRDIVIQKKVEVQANAGWTRNSIKSHNKIHAKDDNEKIEDVV